MVKSMPVEIRLGFLVAIALLLSGCFFPNSLTVSFSEVTGFVSISIAGVDAGVCFQEEEGGHLCDINGITSGLEMLMIPEFIFILIVLDPLVVQVPADLTNFAGAYLNNDSGDSGALEITSGLSSVKIDADRILTAEPGTQLVTIGLPEGAPTEGAFSFNLNFQVPSGTSAIDVKPIITGFVKLTDGTTFYPPLLPCVDDFANAPTLTIPLPAPGGTVSLPPLTPDMGCDNVVYNFIPASLGNDVYLPITIREITGTLSQPWSGPWAGPRVGVRPR